MSNNTVHVMFKTADELKEFIFAIQESKEDVIIIKGNKSYEVTETELFSLGLNVKLYAQIQSDNLETVNDFRAYTSRFAY